MEVSRALALVWWGNSTRAVTHNRVGVLQLQRRFLWLKRTKGCCGWLCVLLWTPASNDHIVIILKHCDEDYCDSVLFRLNIHGLIISIRNNCSVLSFLAPFLELEVFFKDRVKTILFQHTSLMHNGILGCRQCYKVLYSKETLYPDSGFTKKVPYTLFNNSSAPFAWSSWSSLLFCLH